MSEIVMVPVEEILGSWGSVDGEWNPEHNDWDSLLDEKRDDWQYEAVVESLRANGFLRPNTFTVTDGHRVHCDGHHRLAAAIDCGVTHIPYVEVSHWSEGIADDSGCWDGSRPVSREWRSSDDYDDDDDGPCDCEECQAA